MQSTYHTTKKLDIPNRISLNGLICTSYVDKRGSSTRPHLFRRWVQSQYARDCWHFLLWLQHHLYWQHRINLFLMKDSGVPNKACRRQSNCCLHRPTKTAAVLLLVRAGLGIGASVKLLPLRTNSFETNRTTCGALDSCIETCRCLIVSLGAAAGSSLAALHYSRPFPRPIQPLRTHRDLPSTPLISRFPSAHSNIQYCCWYEMQSFHNALALTTHTHGPAASGCWK